MTLNNQDSPEEFNNTWYEEQITKYKEIRPQYTQSAEVLVQVLRDITKGINSGMIIQSRAKGIANFAEKIQRANKHYQNPLFEITDLCGVRVIANTLSDVAQASREIEKHFEIYAEDSEDKLALMKTSEFGYLSRHYIVSFKSGCFSTAIVPDEMVKRALKFEIQVRTVLQHAWADISHELSYKSQFIIPKRWERELTRFAAVLEETDQGFDRLLHELKEYASNYDAYYDKTQIHTELAKAKLTLQTEPDNHHIAYHLAKMAMSIGDLELAINTLQQFEQNGISYILRDLGITLCKQNKQVPESEKFNQGQEYLQSAIELDPKNVDAWASLGGTWRVKENAIQDEQIKLQYQQKARSCYRKAFEIDPGDPFALGNYIEYEILEYPEKDIIPHFRLSLQEAISRCHLQTEVKINLPWAYFDLAKFNLILHDPIKALAYYAKAVAESASDFFVESAQKSFNTLAPVSHTIPGFEWSKVFLEIVRSVGSTTQPAPSIPVIYQAFNDDPIVIIAGYCGTSATDQHRELLIKAFKEFKGTIISGGTLAGIPALVGELQEQYSQKIHSIGYIPGKMPEGVKQDIRYRKHVKTAGDNFSPLEPIQYWRDLLASNRINKQTKLLVIGGKDITQVELCMALALGIPVGLITDNVNNPEPLLKDPAWSIKTEVNSENKLQRLSVNNADELVGFLQN